MTTETEFQPCVMYWDDAYHTEMMLADAAVYWVRRFGGEFELGYDMTTHELVGIRIAGNVLRAVPPPPKDEG